MATITKTYTETGGSPTSFNSTWTVVMTGTNITASGSTVSFLFPTLTGKHVASNSTAKPYGIAIAEFEFASSNGSTVLATTTYKKGEVGNCAWAANTALSIPPMSSGLIVNTSTLFNANNKTSKTVNVSAKQLNIGLETSVNSSMSGASFSRYMSATDVSWGNILTVTLKSPPSFDTTNVTLTSPVYAGYTTATVTVSNMTAYYGGDISSAVLKIGSQTATRTTNGTLSIDCNTAGTFTPTVTVTDSRGQTTTKSLASITILPYVAPDVVFGVERTTDTGVPNDEGESAVITATLTYTDAVASLTAPTIVAKDQDNITVTPTITWYADRALTDVISGWSSVASGAEVYALLGGDVFDTQDSYQISLTPTDIDINNVPHSGTAKLQTLGSAFYTVDFRAGGHGIAFGQACINDGFYCNMDANFKDKAGVMRAMFDFFYPTGSYYETSDNTFDPNVTWGGTWVLETEGMVHISGSDNGTYQISGATTDTQDGGNKDAIIPYHNHTASGGAVTDKASFSTNSSGAVTDGITGGSHHHSIGSSWSSGSGTQTAYTMSSNRSRQSLNSGDSTHKHNLPNHTHTIPSHGHGFTQPTISYAGESVTDKNMQPYIIVNRWHRVA